MPSFVVLYLNILKCDKLASCTSEDLNFPPFFFSIQPKSWQKNKFPTLYLETENPFRLVTVVFDYKIKNSAYENIWLHAQIKTTFLLYNIQLTLFELRVLKYPQKCRFYATFDLSFASTETKFKNPITKTQNNIVIFWFFHKKMILSFWLFLK